MGVYIRGMEIPEHCGYCRFRYDGICHALQKTQYQREDCPLVPVPPHGRLIDADALRAFAYERQKETGIACCVDALDISLAPTIIPASKGETE